MCGQIAYDWNTIPISRRSGGTNVPREASLTSRSPIQMRPASFCSRPAIIRSVVVLPQPLGPSSVTSRPSGTSRDTPSTARTPPNRLATSSTRTPGIALLLVDLLRELEHVVHQLRVGRAEQLRLRQRLGLGADPALEPAHRRHETMIAV